ncbi:hypothetical protein FQR65_LT17213 [Abscondita terminalis]|nr:hypothetical protein FQR65_LT17213 [Abscondita terminalis]
MPEPLIRILAAGIPKRQLAAQSCCKNGLHARWFRNGLHGTIPLTACTAEANNSQTNPDHGAASTAGGSTAAMPKPPERCLTAPKGLGPLPATARADQSCWGTVNITAKQAGNATYDSAPDVTFTLSINKTPLTVTANALSKEQGMADPVLSYTATGFVYNEDLTVLTGALSRAAGEAIETSAAGKIQPIKPTMEKNDLALPEPLIKYWQLKYTKRNISGWNTANHKLLWKDVYAQAALTRTSAA